MSQSPSILQFSFRDYILQAKDSDVCSIISRLVQDYSVLGLTDTAAQLLSHINNLNIFHVSAHHTRALWFLWDVLARTEGKSWPDGERAKLGQAIQYRRHGNNDIIATPSIEEQETHATEVEVASELDLMAQEYAAKWFYPNKPTYSNQPQLTPYHSDRPPLSAQRMIHSAHFIVNYFKELNKPPSERDVQSGLVSALELLLSAQRELGEQPEKVGSLDPFEILSWIMQTKGYRFLVESRHTWSLLRQGTLRTLLDIDETRLAKFAVDLEDAVTKRARNGRQRPPIIGVEASLNTIGNNLRDDAHEAGAPESLFERPATEDQIAAAEHALGLNLPEDYKQFLRRTNGSDPLSRYGPSLHAAHDVRWLESHEDYFTDLPLCIPADWDIWTFLPIEPKQIEFQSDYLDRPAHFYVSKALEIGTHDIDNVWLVPPSKISAIKQRVQEILMSPNYTKRQKDVIQHAVDDFAGSYDEWESLDWCCVTWAAGGSAVMETYPSFQAYLEQVAEQGKKKQEDVALKSFINGDWLGTVFARENAVKIEVPPWLKSAEQISRERYSRR